VIKIGSAWIVGFDKGRKTILHAVENPARDLVVGGAAKAVICSRQEVSWFIIITRANLLPRTRRTICFEPIGSHNAVEESVRDRAHA
jgi:hypothetical protein